VCGFVHTTRLAAPPGSAYPGRDERGSSDDAAAEPASGQYRASRAESRTGNRGSDRGARRAGDQLDARSALSGGPGASQAVALTATGSLDVDDPGTPGVRGVRLPSTTVRRVAA